MDYNNYIQIIHKKNTISRMKYHKDDDSKFFFYFKKNKKLYRKLYTSQGGTRGVRIDDAIVQLTIFYNKCDKLRIDVNQEITVNEYWTEFVALKEWSDRHRYNSNNIYKLYIKNYLGDIKVKAVTHGHIDTVMMKSKSKSKRIQKFILEILEPLFRKAVRDTLLDVTPIDDTHQVKRNFNREKKQILAPNDKFVALHGAIHKLDDVKIRTAFLFGFNGRRLQEVLKMKWDHIDFNGHSYSIPAENSKVDVTMTFALNQELSVLLLELWEHRNSEFIFASNRDPSSPMVRLSQYYEEIRESSGLSDFTFHWMRNLLVSTLANRGVAVADLSAILGHQDTGTINKYLSLQRDTAGMRANDAISDVLSLPVQKLDKVK